MNWLIFLKKFLRNLVIGILFAVLLMSGMGYLFAGKVGFVNGITWGIVFGLLGSFSLGLGALFQADFWGGGNYDKLGEWNWFIKKQDDAHKES